MEGCLVMIRKASTSSLLFLFTLSVFLGNDKGDTLLGGRIDVFNIFFIIWNYILIVLKSVTRPNYFLQISD
jgi:hypothetical protein